MAPPSHAVDEPIALPRGLRMTPQRRALLDALVETRGSFTALELYERARQAKPRLGLATTYRTIELLRRSGSVRSIAGGERPAYVRCWPDHHHHLVCVTCGSVAETELCSAPSAEELKRRYGFAAHAHDADVYGTCARCS